MLMLCPVMYQYITNKIKGCFIIDETRDQRKQLRIFRFQIVSDLCKYVMLYIVGLYFIASMSFNVRFLCKIAVIKFAKISE